MGMTCHSHSVHIDKSDLSFHLCTSTSEIKFHFKLWNISCFLRLTQVLPDTDWCSSPEVWRRSSRSSWHREDRNHERPGQSTGHPDRRLQLLWPARCPRYGKISQGSSQVRHAYLVLSLSCCAGTEGTIYVWCVCFTVLEPGRVLMSSTALTWRYFLWWLNRLPVSKKHNRPEWVRVHTQTHECL